MTTTRDNAMTEGAATTTTPNTTTAPNTTTTPTTVTYLLRTRNGGDDTADTARTTTPGMRTANEVPRPRRSAGTRRPLGPAGSGPGPAGRGYASAGRGPSRSTPLPTVGAQRRAQESRPHLWFAHQLVLTLSGQRPVHALLGHALPAAYDRLAELAPQAPLRPRLGPGRGGPVPTVRECGLCRPGRGVIEAFARIATGERLRALAFRLELGADSRWRCAALDIGPAPAAWSPAP